MLSVGDRIKAIRGSLSQQEFGKKIGVTISAVQKWEYKDQLPKGDILFRIHEEFGIDINWLLTGKGEPYAPPESFIKRSGPFEATRDISIDTKFAERIRELRAKARLSSKEAAQALGISSLDYDGFERGYRPSAQFTETISRLFKCNYHQLFTGKQPEEIKPDEDMSEFAKRLVLIRTREHKSQQEVADAIGFSLEIYQELEKNAVPDAETVKDLANYLNENPNWLYPERPTFKKEMFDFTNPVALIFKRIRELEEELKDLGYWINPDTISLATAALVNSTTSHSTLQEIGRLSRLDQGQPEE